jgi:hypothetical protein
MLTTPHAVAGATIGVLLPTPWLAIPIAIGSHFVLDRVPHWQETLAPYKPTKKTYIRIPFDIALSIGLVLLITTWHPDAAPAIWLGAIFANAPDLDTIVLLIPRLKTGLLQRFWDWHCRIQRETSSLWGLAPQLLVILVGLVISRMI